MGKVDKMCSIAKAISTVFFQEGFDRETGRHGLEYWNVEEKDLHEHCRSCKIESIEDHRSYNLNTVKGNDSWYLRLFVVIYDEFEEFSDIKVKLMIQINPKRLCWEEISRCMKLIYEEM